MTDITFVPASRATLCNEPVQDILVCDILQCNYVGTKPRPATKKVTSLCCSLKFKFLQPSVLLNRSQIASAVSPLTCIYFTRHIAWRFVLTTLSSLPISINPRQRRQNSAWTCWWKRTDLYSRQKSVDILRAAATLYHRCLVAPLFTVHISAQLLQRTIVHTSGHR